MRRALDRRLDNQRALVLRPICIPDVDRNSLCPHREDRILMQHGGAHVGKLSQLPVGDRLDGLRILHDVRIRDQAA